MITAGEYLTNAPEETFLLAKRLSEEAGPGEVILLEGELGAGKTLFAQGFAAGLGITDIVASPTFTILQIHASGRIPLYHFDLYRLQEEEEFFAIGGDEYFDGKGICLMEWALQFSRIIPAPFTLVRIEKLYERGDEARRILIGISGNG